MTDITIIGLGSMGSALAKTLLLGGHSITVWNRNQEKAKQLSSDGAMIGETIVDAVRASPIVLVCINNYVSTESLFKPVEVLSALKHRIVVQMSSGTPKEAIDAEHWFRENEIGYLDGALLASPKDIGTKEGQILIAGNQNHWFECKPILDCLAGNFQHSGTNIDAAKILDLAWLCQRFGLFMGVFQGLLLCEAGGVGLDVFGTTVANDSRVSRLANTIQNNTYGEPVNTIKVWKEALHHIQVHAEYSGVNIEILDFIFDKFQRAQTAGFETEDLAALIKVFR